MKIQNIFPYDTAVLGLQGLYHTVGNDSFYINNPHIMVKDHIVTTGESYFFFERENDGHKIKFRTVTLNDTFFYNQRVYLLLNDLILDEVLLRNLVLKNVHTKCQWKLFDFDTFKNILVAKEKEFYCNGINHNAK